MKTIYIAPNGYHVKPEYNITRNNKNKYNNMKVSEVKINEQYGNALLTFSKARIAFSGNGDDLFYSKQFQDRGNSRWGCSLILTPEDAKLVAEAEKQLAKHFKIDLADLGKNNRALRDGDKNVSKSSGEVYEGFAGNKYVSCAKNDNTKGEDGRTIPRDSDNYPKKPSKAPQVRQGAGILITAPDDERVKQDGAYVNAQVSVYFQPKYGTFGVSPQIIAYRNDEFEGFGGGMVEQDADSLYEGIEGSELDEGSIAQDDI